MSGFRAVLFDWRGTLVTTLGPQGWVRAALQRLGRDHHQEAVTRVWERIAVAAGDPDRLDSPGVDRDATVHREAYYGVFADAGLDPELADALYAVESDAAYNLFAVDVAETLHGLVRRGCRIGVVSDIHFDIRPAFASAGIDGFIDTYVLSCQHGVQKPDPAIFRLALARLGTTTEETLMVGDRRIPDGGAVDLGITTLLLPPLTEVRQRRLHLVTTLVDGAAAGSGGYDRR